MFHVDPIRDDHGGGHDDFQIFSRRILPVIIRVQKGSTFEIEAVRQATSADDKRRVPR